MRQYGRLPSRLLQPWLAGRCRPASRAGPASWPTGAQHVRSAPVSG